MMLVAGALTSVLVIAALAASFFSWRARGAAEVEPLALECQDLLGDVIAEESPSSERDGPERSRKLEKNLTLLTGTLRDRKLRKLLRSALADYATALGPKWPDGPVTRHEAACKAYDTLELALNRVQRLKRWHVIG